MSELKTDITITREFVIDLIMKHSKRDKSFRDKVGNVLNVHTIYSDEHERELLNSLSNNELENLLNYF